MHGKEFYTIKANVELIDGIQPSPNFFVLGPKVSFIKHMLKTCGKKDRLIVNINKDTVDKKNLFDYLSTLKDIYIFLLVENDNIKQPDVVKYSDLTKKTKKKKSKQNY